MSCPFAAGAEVRRPGAQEGASVPRFRLPRLAAPHRAGLLLAACCGLGVGFGCAGAAAQSAQNAQGAAATYTDPFAPQPQTAIGKKPPRFEKFSNKKLTSDNGLPRTFQPLKPLAGRRPARATTGFNATQRAGQARDHAAPRSMAAGAMARRPMAPTTDAGTDAHRQMR